MCGNSVVLQQLQLCLCGWPKQQQQQMLQWLQHVGCKGTLSAACKALTTV
jgi:hypothetical protein